MNNYNEMIGETIGTDCGDYEIVAHIYDDGCRDTSINLYVGKAADGHHDLIASGNASMWVVGDEDDADRNRGHWDLIAERVGEIDFDAIRAIDADLAEWLEDRKAEAVVEVGYEVWRVPNGRFNDWSRGITSGCFHIGDLIADLEEANELRESCRDDDDRYACTHHIRKVCRDHKYELIDFEVVY